MKRRGQLILWAVGAWTVATGLQTLVLAAQEGVFLPFALASSATYYGILAVLAVPVWRICAWSGRRRERRWSAALVQAVTATAVLALWHGGYFGLLYLMAGEAVVRLQLDQAGLWVGMQAIFVYSVLVAGIFAVQAGHRLKRQREREEQLRLYAREAEVRALRAQLRPHFLFNVLNSIYSLIASRPEEAQQMVALLAELMQKTLEVSDERFVPLGDEIDLVRSYLEIERIRLGERLALEIELEPGTAAAPVPPLLLQPLVENSIRHGISRNPAPGRVAVSAARRNGSIELVVRDSGGGERAAGPAVEGRGLGITRQRLAAHYEGRATLDLSEVAGGGYEARILLPPEPPGTQAADG